MSKKTALALMAHPDDAEILCAGTLIRLKQSGWEVHIVTVANGDCGSMTESQDTIAKRRLAEATDAANFIGATYEGLGEGDIFVVYDKPTLHKAIDLFRRIAPQLVFTHSPLDYMMDHVIVSQLARAASFGHGTPNASALPLLDGTCVPHLYYCDPLDGTDPLGHPVTPSTWVDITEQIETKMEMLGRHRSQRDWLRDYHGTDEYIDAMRRHAAFRGREIDKTSAEAFVQHRGHAYPKNDILHELFS